jgi:predicted Zn finger-like uncharacterized protein
MFTRCPHCNTVFRIYAEQLAQAQGRVRCGICDSGFNALEYLSESPSGFAAPAAVATDAEEPFELPEEIDFEPPPDQTEAITPEPEFETQRLEAEGEQPVSTDDDGATEIPPTQMEATTPDLAFEAQQPAPDQEQQPLSATDSGGIDDIPSAKTEATAPDRSFEVQQPAPDQEQQPLSATDSGGIDDIPSAQTEATAPDRSFEVQRPAPDQEQPLAEADSGETDVPPLIPLEPESTGFTSPWENAAVRQATNDDVAVPAFRILPDKPADAPPPAQAEEDQEAAPPPSGHDDADLPDLGIIAAEPRRMSAEETAGGWLKTTVWTVTNIALIVLLLGQYTYFNRNDLSQYPDLRPWLTRFCALVSCNTPLRRDVSHINLANRIVQSHPSHPNALLIKATLVNEADFPQPYPLLEIRFSDLNNQLVAGRRFRPSEYLPANTSIQAGMPPHQPVHISLEVVDPGKEAVSFQFELL